jgi:hypothetical protein
LNGDMVDVVVADVVAADADREAGKQKKNQRPR